MTKVLRKYTNSMKESINTLVWVWQTLIDPGSKKFAYRGILGLIMGGSLSMIVPWILGERIIPIIQAEKYMSQTVWFWFAIMGIAVIVSRSGMYFFERNRERQAGLNLGCIDDVISKKMFEKSLGQHVREKKYLGIANIEKGRARVQAVYEMIMFQALPVLNMILFSFLFLCIMNPLIGGIVSIIFVVYVSWSLYLNHHVSIVGKGLDEEFRAINRHRVERWEKSSRVIISGQAKTEVRLTKEKFKEIISRDLSFWLWFINQASFRGTLSRLSIVAIMIVGIWQFTRGDIAIGELLPIFMWSQNIIDNLWQIGHIEHQVNWNMPSIKSLRCAIELPPDIVDAPNAINLPKKPINISFDNISYGYAGETVIRDISFDINTGEKVALIGPSGAGKSTLVKLLLRAMNPDSGDIIVNGTNLKDIKRDSWCGALGYIPQKPVIFDGTIRENLLYGVPYQDRETPETAKLLKEVMENLQVNFSGRMDTGLDTFVGYDGLELSGGEQQRVAAAAAVMHQPRFMIIDEATSSLDSETEQSFQYGLEKILTGERSAIIIAHRLSTLKRCDKFIVLRPLQEVQEGENQIEAIANSFEELYCVSKTFQKLANAQGLMV